MEHLLSIIIFFPLLASVIGFVLDSRVAKAFGIAVAFVELVLVCWLWFLFDVNAGFQFSQKFALISSFGIDYHIGVDGVSLFLLFLNAVVIFACSIYVNEERYKNHFIASLLAIEGILMGVFSALNVMLFYIFWELSLIPLLYMIGVWGSGDRIYAALKFFIYTFLASVVMLLGIIYCAYLIYTQNGFWSFDLLDWYESVLPLKYQVILFLAFFFAIAVKIPIFPFHTWLPYAYGNAPTLGSVILSAVLLKMGTYALVRFSIPLFPDASSALEIWIIVLALFMIIYGGMLAYAQKDIKQVIAYSSISHMGVVVLGIFSFTALGISGAIFMMFAHGIATAALFISVGICEDRIKSREVSEFGGLAKIAPLFSFLFGVALMSNVGLPLSIGFVGEFLSLLGVFKASFFVALLGGITIIISAAYMLNLYKKIFFGKARILEFSALVLREKIVLWIFALFIVVLGIYPTPLLKPIQNGAQQMLEIATSRIQEPQTAQRFFIDQESSKLDSKILESSANRANQARVAKITHTLGD